MIPVPILLRWREIWRRKTYDLTISAYEAERQNVERLGTAGFETRRWENVYLAVWTGAGDPWHDLTRLVIAVRAKGLTDNPETWRTVLQTAAAKASATVAANAAEFHEVGTVFYETVIPRAERIAATETVQATGFAQHTAAAAYPHLTKIWQATLDESTRPTHMAAHGQRRRINDPYDVGGAALQWPADAGAPLAEVINCRCWEDYELVRPPPGAPPLSPGAPSLLPSGATPAPLPQVNVTDLIRTLTAPVPGVPDLSGVDDLIGDLYLPLPESNIPDG